VIFVPLERLLDLRPGQRILRRAWPLDLIHVATTGILVKLGLGFAILALMLVAQELISNCTLRSLRRAPERDLFFRANRRQRWWPHRSDDC